MKAIYAFSTSLHIIQFHNHTQIGFSNISTGLSYSKICIWFLRQQFQTIPCVIAEFDENFFSCFNDSVPTSGIGKAALPPKALKKIVFLASYSLFMTYHSITCGQILCLAVILSSLLYILSASASLKRILILAFRDFYNYS